MERPAGIERYEILGHVPGGTAGANATVFQAHDCVRNELVAIKQVAIRDSADTGIPVEVVREMATLRSVQHPHVVSVHDIFVRTSRFHIVFELMAGNLRHYLRAFAAHPTDKWVPIEDCQRIFRQVMSAVAFCHDRNIIHRDLKPDNILVDEGGQLVKVADFGMARVLHTDAHDYTEDMVTAWYRPPEIMLGETRYHAAVDVWSAACILVEMATLQPLFPCGSQWECLLSMFQLLGTPCEDTWPGCTDLPQYCIQFPQWRKRRVDFCLQLGAADLPHKSDPDFLNLLELMLVLDPEQRISASTAIRRHPFLRQDNGVHESSTDEEEEESDDDDDDDHEDGSYPLFVSDDEDEEEGDEVDDSLQASSIPAMRHGRLRGAADLNELEDGGAREREVQCDGDLLSGS